MPSPDAILHDPDWFPDRIDVANRLIRLVPTTRRLLGESAFLDGRTPFARTDSTPIVIPLEAFVDGLRGPVPPQRWILHRSFCGSTLLSRIAAADGVAVALREPQALVDLANWRIASPTASGFVPVRDALLVKLAQRWRPDEPIVVKPSNWINPVVADLWSPARGDRAVVIDIALDRFVVAVLRGGRDRIAYTLRLYAQIAAAWPDLADVVARATPRTSAAPMVQAARLIAATHWAQDCVLAGRAAAAGIDLATTTIRFPAFLQAAATLAATVRRRLDLSGDPGDAAADHIARHAKAPERAADAAAEAEANRMIRVLNEDAIGSALAFGEALAAARGPAIDRIVVALRAADGCARGVPVAGSAA